MLSPLVFSGPLVHALHSWAGPSRLGGVRWLSEGLADAWWAYFGWAVCACGPTFIKLVQWAVARPDLFPEALISRLSYVHDLVRVHPWSHTEHALTAALGEGWQRYLEIHHEPIGSGCIASVYRGLLVREAAPPSGMKHLLRLLLRPSAGCSEGGEVECLEVAVKVVHPRVRQEILGDLRLLAGLAGAVQRLKGISFVSPQELVELFSQAMLMQLDLRLEAANLERFGRNFSREQLLQARVCFPQPVLPYVTDQVLVETFVHGRPVRDFLDADVETRCEIARLGVQSIMKMIFLDNFLHADLHPGNVMICTKLVSSRAGQPSAPRPQLSLVFLDAGMVTTLSANDHKHLSGILSALFSYDGKLVASLIAQNQMANSHEDDSPPDLPGFLKGVQQIADEAQQLGDAFMDHLGGYLTRMSSLACTCHVKLNAAFLTIALAMKLTEGFHVALDASGNLQQLGRPILVKANLA